MIQFAKQLTQSMAFRTFIIVVILLAGVLAGLETSASLVAKHFALLHALNLAVIGIFLVEIALKLVAHGRRPLDFFRDGWNVFDCVIVAFCLLPVAGPFAAVIRLARVLRLLRLVSALPKLQLLVGALIKSLSAMGYVSILLALLFYIYAVAGVNLFGKTDPGHFGSLGAALLSLFRIVTLDNWGDIYFAQAAHVPEVKVAIYFATFIVFGTMIILNLFIGIILNSMSEAHSEQALHTAKEAEATLPSQGVLARLDHTTKQLAELQTALAGLRRELELGPAAKVPSIKSSCPSNPSSPSPPSPPLSSCRAC
jgi:voltage-gated sodium channel